MNRQTDSREYRKWIEKKQEKSIGIAAVAIDRRFVPKTSFCCTTDTQGRSLANDAINGAFGGRTNVHCQIGNDT